MTKMTHAQGDRYHHPKIDFIRCNRFFYVFLKRPIYLVLFTLKYLSFPKGVPEMKWRGRDYFLL